MRDFSDELKSLRARLDEAHNYLRIDDTRARHAELEAVVQEPDLWEDQDRARAVNAAYARARGDIEEYDGLASAVEDVEVLYELAREEGDDTQEPDIEASLLSLNAKLDELELRSLF